MIEVVRSGLLTTIQDLGRPGYAHLGVPRSGALDTAALVLANRLLGNPDRAAGLETTLTGVTFRAETSTAVVVTGAPARITVDGQPVEFGRPFPVRSGSVVVVSAVTVGVRSYVAFAGGVTVAPVLGSRSTDTLSGLGPPPLRAGFVFPVGRVVRSHPPADAAACLPEGTTLGPDGRTAHATVSAATATAGTGTGTGTGTKATGTTTTTTSGGPPVGAASRDATTMSTTVDDGAAGSATQASGVAGHAAAGAGQLRLRVRLGPRHDWFSLAARDTLFASPYALSVKSNRVGARMTGPALDRTVRTELPSEGIVLGAVQVPADGQPLVFLADHPTTGGYPVIGVVDVTDLPLLAQARPGATIMFAPWT